MLLHAPLLEAYMAGIQSLPGLPSRWGAEAIVLAEQAKVLSGNKLAQLVRRLQRRSGRTQEECRRFVIKYRIKSEVDYHRWHQEELDEARELLTKYSVEEVAKRMNRSAKALRNALQRRALRVREIAATVSLWSLLPGSCTCVAAKSPLGSSSGSRRRSRNRETEPVIASRPRL